MSPFPKRKTPSLHELHADAHLAGERALSIFHTVAGELQAAADAHLDVADQAQQQINALVSLRESADRAATEKANKAKAVAGLVA